MDDGRRLPADRSGLPPRTLLGFRYANHGCIFLLVLAVARAVVGPGALRPRLLRRWRHAHSHGCRHVDHQRFVADLFAALPQVRRGWPGLGFRYWHRSEPAGAGLAAALPKNGFAGNAALG